MRLVRIEAHDFAQYADLDLDLSTVSELAVLGENGAGKSQLVNMMSWCLTGRPARGPIDRLIRDGTYGTWVRTTWDDQGTEVVILRTRSTETKAGESSLALQLDGVRQTKHTIAETQAVITEMAGLTYEQLMATVWSTQGEADAPMTMTPAAMKSFVNGLLELDRFEPWRERAAGMKDDADRMLAIAQDRSARLEERLADELPVRAAAKKASEERGRARAAEDAAERTRAELHVRATALNERLTQARVLSTEIDGLNRQVDAEQKVIDARSWVTEEQPPRPPDPPEFDRDVWAGYVKAARDQAAEYRQVETRHREVGERIRHDDQMRAAAKDLCDVCPFRSELLPEPEYSALIAEHTKLAAWLEAHAGMDSQETGIVERAQTAKAAAELAAHQLAAWQERQARWTTDTAEGMAATARRDAANARLTAANRERMEHLQVQAEADEVADLLTAASMALRDAAAARAAAEARSQEAERRLAELAEVKVELEASRAAEEQHGARADVLRDVVRMFHRDGLPSFILAEAVPAIEAKANELLERMPGELSLTVEMQRQTKTGQWRDEMTVTVVEKQVDRLYDTLSGAQRYRVDLAWRLALGSVLLTRAGRRFETLVLDETFSAQSEAHLQGVLDSIAAIVSDYGLSIIVTHQQAVADRIPAKLHVVRNELDLAEVLAS